MLERYGKFIQLCDMVFPQLSNVMEIPRNLFIFCSDSYRVCLTGLNI